MFATALKTMPKRNYAERPKMSPIEYKVWRDFIEERCGILYNESQIQYLSRCLWNRMGVNGAASFGEYYRYVAFSLNGKDEWKRLQELLVNNETSFFRHAPSYEALANRVLPDLLSEKLTQGIKTISMWSAGCSTGQEPYSMAMAAMELENSHGCEIKVYGSDISERALEKAHLGVFSSYESRRLPFFYCNKYMSLVESGGDFFKQVKDDLKSRVHFGDVNLNDMSRYSIPGQDIIFCQNVLIYFRPEKRIEIVRQLSQRLNPGGYLFLAPAEVVGLRIPGIQSVRLQNSLVYQRAG